MEADIDKPTEETESCCHQVFFVSALQRSLTKSEVAGPSLPVAEDESVEERRYKEMAEEADYAGELEGMVER